MKSIVAKRSSSLSSLKEGKTLFFQVPQLKILRTGKKYINFDTPVSAEFEEDPI